MKRKPKCKVCLGTGEDEKWNHDNDSYYECSACHGTGIEPQTEPKKCHCGQRWDNHNPDKCMGEPVSSHQARIDRECNGDPEPMDTPPKSHDLEIPKELQGRFTLHNILCIEANIMDCEEAERIEKLVREWIRGALPAERFPPEGDLESEMLCGGFNACLDAVRKSLLEG